MKCPCVATRVINTTERLVDKVQQCGLSVYVTHHVTGIIRYMSSIWVIKTTKTALDKVQWFQSSCPVTRPVVNAKPFKAFLSSLPLPVMVGTWFIQ